MRRVETLIKKMKKHWILIWLVAVLLIAATLVTYGAYTGLRSVKRVVTTKRTEGKFFSSNCMRSSVVDKKINVQEFEFTVCNYEQNDSTACNSANVTYVLTADVMVLYDGEYYTMSELATKLGASSSTYTAIKTSLDSRTYSIAKTEDDASGPSQNPLAWNLLNADNGYNHVFTNQSLAGAVSSTDMFKVQFDSQDLESSTPSFFIRVKAESAEMGTLECRLYAVKPVSEASGWQGAFVENVAGTDSYDFYNYVISGNGVGTVLIAWDATKIELSPFFFSAVSGNAVSGVSDYNITGWKQVTLTVNSETKNRYELQIYKAQAGLTYVGGNSPSNFIICTFTSSQ